MHWVKLIGRTVLIPTVLPSYVRKRVIAVVLKEKWDGPSYTGNSVMAPSFTYTSVTGLGLLQVYDWYIILLQVCDKSMSITVTRV